MRQFVLPSGLKGDRTCCPPDPLVPSGLFLRASNHEQSLALRQYSLVRVSTRPSSGRLDGSVALDLSRVALSFSKSPLASCLGLAATSASTFALTALTR